MRYIKNFESIREEYPGMFEPIKPEDEPQEVPGFDRGTIDPEDDEVYHDIDPMFDEMSEKERYETIFLKLVKERNFIETPTEIKINLRKLAHDYCMSISHASKHLKKFLNDELRGKYITKGFVDVMNSEPDDEIAGNIEGIIENVISVNIDNQCSALINLKVKDSNIDKDNTICTDSITIDKKKTMFNRFSL